jgi:hypothetical protein
MKITRPLVLSCVVALALALPAAAGTRKPGFARAIAEKLLAKKTPKPQIHTTDFAGQNIGCITLSRREVRSFGYPGHAFVCEEASAGEVLGALLTRAGVPICEIFGFYAGDGCYDLTICDNAETLCVVQ